MGLEPDVQLLHYRLTARLGEGGMGEVWRAVDTKLDREVAIKVLPEPHAADPDRIARFEREAKAVARLSHPNIVTVYAVEQAEGTRFVAMEIVHGQTLSDLIPKKGFPLDRLFELAIPLADAVTAAHRQGVIHRDLKPGNIMVSDEGRVKVLDFGLARLAEPGPDTESLSERPTDTKTAAGRILGTPDYMSPEQAEGKPVDHRSDLFSLGVVLYEMTTGERPFQGDSPASVLSSILRDTPSSVTDLRPSLPPHLGRIVRHCLAKDPERRYQTAQDVRNELEELQSEVRSGEWRPPSGGETPRRRGKAWVVGLAAAAVALTVLVLLLGGRGPARRSEDGPASASAGVRIVPLTRSGTVEAVGISPDARYVVYVDRKGGRSSLRIRQLATGSEQVLVPPGEAALDDPQVAPDLEWVYYRSRERRVEEGGQAPQNESAVYRIPLLGGRPQRILEGVKSPFALSPDGRRIAFWREWETGKDRVWVASADGSGVATLEGAALNEVNWALAWSPDGEALYLMSRADASRIEARVTAVPLGGGSPQSIGEDLWVYVPSLVSLPGAGGLIVAGRREAEGFQSHERIWRLGASGSGLERLTHDLSSYRSLSLDRSGTTLAAVQTRFQNSVWVLPDGDEEKARQVSFTSQAVPSGATVAWLPDGDLVYDDLDGEDLHIWRSTPDGAVKERLTREGTFNGLVSVSPTGTTLAYTSTRSGGLKIWLSDLDGDRARPLTEEQTEEVFPAFSPDGQWVVYSALSSTGLQHLVKARISGGAPVQLVSFFSVGGAVSSDGRRVALAGRDPEDGQNKILVADFETGEIQTRVWNLHHWFSPHIKWTPDGRGLATAVPEGEARYLAWNLVVHPLDGGAPRRLTHFTEGVIGGFDWAPDGKTLALVRSRHFSDAVLITDLPATED